MVHIEKRKVIWSLNEVSEGVIDFIQKQTSGSTLVECKVFTQILGHFGFEDSPVLQEILGLAIDHDDRIVDSNLLFQVISQAVARILDRNALFWNTVMTVSSSSIPWIDFRRKLSKWLSASGKDVLFIKKVVAFVQENVDRQSSGVVKKEAFLKFVEQLMGVDCLLYLEELIPLANKSRSVRGSPISQSKEVLKPKSSPTNYQDPKTRFVEQVQANRPPSLVVKQEPELLDIRVRLGVGILAKLADARMRWWFVVDGIRKPIKSHVPDARTHYVVMCIKAIVKRIKMNAFSKIVKNSSVSQVVKDLASEEGPSWSVTIQAVAVTNLFGIMRSALVRARLPGFLSMKAGRCVDDPYCPPPISYAQSNQGKKDSQVAMKGVSKGILQPIDENVNVFEFDLSH